jgi:hypothetical protein
LKTLENCESDNRPFVPVTDVAIPSMSMHVSHVGAMYCKFMFHYYLVWFTFNFILIFPVSIFCLQYDVSDSTYFTFVLVSKLVFSIEQ